MKEKTSLDFRQKHLCRVEWYWVIGQIETALIDRCVGTLLHAHASKTKHPGRVYWNAWNLHFYECPD
jgi:hypothetical protein